MMVMMVVHDKKWCKVLSAIHKAVKQLMVIVDVVCEISFCGK